MVVVRGKIEEKEGSGGGGWEKRRISGEVVLAGRSLCWFREKMRQVFFSLSDRERERKGKRVLVGSEIQWK